MNVCDCVCAVVQSMVNVCVVGTIVTTLSFCLDVCSFHRSEMLLSVPRLLV